METKAGIKVLEQTIDNAHSKSIPQENEILVHYLICSKWIENIQIFAEKNGEFQHFRTSVLLLFLICQYLLRT